MAATPTWTYDPASMSIADGRGAILASLVDPQVGPLMAAASDLARIAREHFEQATFVEYAHALNPPAYSIRITPAQYEALRALLAALPVLPK